MNIKQYAGVNALNEKKNGEKMPHEELFTKVVNGIGLDFCKPYMPVTTDELRDALKKDPHLNNIKLKKWEDMHAQFSHAFHYIGVNRLSMSDMTCTLKQAARMLVAEEYPEAYAEMQQKAQLV